MSCPSAHVNGLKAGPQTKPLKCHGPVGDVSLPDLPFFVMLLGSRTSSALSCCDHFKLQTRHSFNGTCNLTHRLAFLQSLFAALRLLTLSLLGEELQIQCLHCLMCKSGRYLCCRLQRVTGGPDQLYIYTYK